MIGEIDNIYDDEDKYKLIIYKKQDNLYQDFLFNCDVDTKKYIIDFFYLHYFAKEYDKKWKIRFDIKLELSKFERLIYQQQFTLYSDDLMKQSFIDDVPNIIDSYIDRNFRSNYNSSDGLYDLSHKITSQEIKIFKKLSDYFNKKFPIVMNNIIKNSIYGFGV